jgi:hypothetical protein
MAITTQPATLDNFGRIDLVDGVPVKKVVVHTFTVGDVEDPDLWAADPLYQWENSEAGQWVMANAVDRPSWHRQPDLLIHGYRYIIVARLRGIDQTFFELKYR